MTKKRQVISDSLAQTKPHYNILDGLRGIAALMVILYHIGEGFATSVETQWCNHGYLAVQFFFVLSGFVIGYAYDNRWGAMGVKEFFRRRLIRLHPMVVLGIVLGIISFVAQGCVTWEGVQIEWTWIAVAGVMTLFMLPTAPGWPTDIRGNGEIFPINGPYWSLFCEYVGNILYALWVRRLSTRNLAILTAVCGIGVACFAIGNGSGHYHLGVGWTMTDWYLPAGLMGMMFCFSIGLLMSRVFKPIQVRGAFWWCSLGVVVLTAMPHLGAPDHSIYNGIYECVCVLFIFPVIVWLGASGVTTDRATTAFCRFWGDVSYPLYVVHYPSMYFFYAWVWNNELTFPEVWPVCIALIIGNIALAYAALRIYDIPVRRWLSRPKSQLSPANSEVLVP